MKNKEIVVALPAEHPFSGQVYKQKTTDIISEHMGYIHFLKLTSSEVVAGGTACGSMIINLEPAPVL